MPLPDIREKLPRGWAKTIKTRLEKKGLIYSESLIQKVLQGRRKNKEIYDEAFDLAEKEKALNEENLQKEQEYIQRAKAL